MNNPVIKSRDTVFALQVTTDLALLAATWILSYYFRFYSFLETVKGVPTAVVYLKLTPFVIIIWALVFSASGFYRRTGRHHSPFTEGLDIIQSCALATVCFIAFTYFYEEYRYSRITLLIFALVHPWLIILGRSLLRKVLRYRKRKAKPRQSLIIGGGGAAIQQAIALTQFDRFAKTTIMGVVLVGNSEQVEEGRKICEEKHLKVLTMQRDWPAFFSDNPVQNVVIAVPQASYAFLDEHLDKIVDQVPDVKLVPDLAKYTKLGAGIDLISGTPVISIHESPLAGVGSIFKRIMDFCGAVFGLLIFSPVMLVTGILVPLSSRGPILFKQERMGLDGHTFRILKFRTMPVDAEVQTGAVWATEHDHRPTPLGKFLRKSCIDELPQLFNVLLGEMSLVGPRPERPVFVNQFRRNVPGYMLRHKVKAGLTGWAQVNGWRGNTSIEKRIEYDLQYIQNWSLWFDVRIILMTVFKGIFNKNAY